MFDLAAFDREIARTRRQDHPGDDVLLAQSLRRVSEETGVTRLGTTSTALIAALLLASITGPDLFGPRQTGGNTVAAHPILAETMHLGGLPGDARTWPHDPNRDRS